jgi:ferredoxin
MSPIEKPIDDEDEECATTVMSVADSGACIGCGACARVCARGAHGYA